MGLRRVGHDWVTSLSLFTFMHWRKKCQPTTVFFFFCSCLENPRDEGAWWATVYGVAQSQDTLKWLNSSSSGIMVSKSWVEIYLCFMNFKVSKKKHLQCILVFKLRVQNCTCLVMSSQNVVNRPASLESPERTYYRFPPYTRLSGERPGNMCCKELYAVLQKPIQHCKVIILQLKIK